MVSHVELESQFTFLLTRDYSLRSKRFCAVQQKRTRVKDRVACVAGAKRGGEGEKSTYPFRRLLRMLKTARKVAQVKKRLSFLFSRGQNRKSPSQVFLCSETKRKRLLRRLTRLHACAPNRCRVAATCFASITHGATCRRGTGHKVQVGVDYEKLGVGHYFLTR